MAGKQRQEAGLNNKELKSGKGMTRGEALAAIGTLAAGLPLLHGSLKGLDISFPETAHETGGPQIDPLLEKEISKLEYLTPADKFIVQRRGNPVLTEISSGKLSSIGLTPDTWSLEIMTDPESNSELERPMTREKGNAFRWTDLMNLAEKHAVRFLHVLACTNAPRPYGMGLWEGVPLRDVLWMAGPKQNIRRIFYYGYHNDDPRQLFQSSLHISRVLEEAPGELPVILCYRLNGRPLSQANGGPVRLVVPGLYGNRSIKWLQGIVVTNSYKANDTYAEANNDVESPVKTCARFLHCPETAGKGESFAVTGLAQAGSSGLNRVQYCLHTAAQPLPADDPYFSSAEWHDAIILPPPVNWGSDLPGGRLPEVMQIDPKTGKPYSWPIPNTIVNWAALVKINTPGKYELRCRTIDGNGIAQPLPRPFGHSGINRIEMVTISVGT